VSRMSSWKATVRGVIGRRSHSLSWVGEP